MNADYRTPTSCQALVPKTLAGDDVPDFIRLKLVEGKKAMYKSK